MAIAWRSLWQRCSRIKSGWVLVVLVASVYYGAIAPSRDFRGIAEQRATGLAAVEGARHEHWFQPSPQQVREERVGEGVVGRAPGGPAMWQKGAAGSSDEESRKIVRTSSFALVVERPAEAGKKIQQLVEGAGGFLVNWDANGGQEATTTSLMVRVPVAKFEATRASILKLAQRVETESVQAQDVTKQYVDDETRLRNLRAQETQYLAILKLAHTVKDTLEVSEKLNEVRRDIELQQSQFNTLSKQVDLVAVAVSLRRETEAQLFGLPWHPAYEVKFAARRGLEGLLDYSTSVMSFLFYLPAIVLWLATIMVGAAIGWRILRRMARMFFTLPKQVPAEKVS